MKKLVLGAVILMFSLSIQSCSCCCGGSTPDTTELLPFFVNNAQQTTIVSQDNFTSAEDLLK